MCSASRLPAPRASLRVVDLDAHPAPTTTHGRSNFACNSPEEVSGLEIGSLIFRDFRACVDSCRGGIACEICRGVVLAAPWGGGALRTLSHPHTGGANCAPCDLQSGAIGVLGAAAFRQSPRRGNCTMQGSDTSATRRQKASHDANPHRIPAYGAAAAEHHHPGTRHQAPDTNPTPGAKHRPRMPNRLTVHAAACHLTGSYANSRRPITPDFPASVRPH